MINNNIYTYYVQRKLILYERKKIHCIVEDLEYLNNIIFNPSKILSNVTKRVLQKLLYSVCMFVSFGRSTTS